jgi:hypothetical protein
MMVRAQENPPPEEIFDYLKMFKHVAVSDEALASLLPVREVEWSDNRQAISMWMASSWGST